MILQMKKIGYYFRKAWETSRAHLILTVLRNLFTAVISLIDIVGIGIVVEAMISGKSHRDVIVVILIYLSANLLIILIGQILTLCENKAVRKASNVLQYQYMQDCIDVDYHYVQDKEILNLKRKSMRAHPVFSLNSFGNCINYFVQIAGLAFIFAYLSPLFLTMIIAISTALITLTMFTQKCDYNFSNERTEDDRKLKYLYEVMTKYQYAKEVRINGADKLIESKYKSVFFAFFNRFKKLLIKKFGITVLGVFLTCVQSAAMYFYFTYQVFSGDLNLANYVVLLASTTAFTTSLLALFKNIGLINQALKASDLYQEYEELLKNNRVLRDSNLLPPEEIDILTAELAFVNVSFRYPGASSDTLKKINLKIPAGKKLGIVGLNGSGKTTLIKLILRLYKPTEGEITLGGIDISLIPYHQYSEYLGVMLQDFFLFAYSLKENIVFDRECNEKRLTGCLEQCGLVEKISTLPSGIHTSVYRELDDRGIELSGGEGQKLAMARVIYKNADILILDEPTSALDAIAEQALFSRLNEIANGKTTVFITHRISSTVFCDQIVVIDNGAIVEEGTHTKLVNHDGVYAKLFHSQAKYYEKEREIAL